MKEVRKAINEIYEASKLTELYRQMCLRKGKPVIHKGSEKPIILFVGEAGGKEEDKCGTPFVGRSGRVLDEWMKYTNEKEIAVINAVPIMPEINGSIRKPTDEEIEYFRPHTIKLIEALKPKYIVMVGRSAEKCLSSKQNGCGEWDRNRATGYGIAHFGFIYHPSYYLRNGQSGKKDFLNLMRKKP